MLMASAEQVSFNLFVEEMINQDSFLCYKVLIFFKFGNTQIQNSLTDHI
jgi:hypothetical protein